MSLVDDLTTAAAKGITADVEALLLNGAEVNGVNRFGRTALQVSGTRCAPSPKKKGLIIGLKYSLYGSTEQSCEEWDTCFENASQSDALSRESLENVGSD